MEKSNIPKTHLFTEKDLHLYEIQNIYTACSLWLENGMESNIATYDLIIRDLPKNRNFFIFGGLEEIIEGIRKWRFNKEDIAYLKGYGLTTPKLEKYLKDFKFSGDIWAMPEGSVFFPGEPVLRITAPLLEGNLISMFLINCLSSNTTFTSKIVRSVLASGTTKLFSGGGMRAHGFESAMKGTRAGYIVGALSGFPAFYRKYNLDHPPVSINMYHAVIKSFPTEIEAMRAGAKLFPNNSRPMVDTYNFKQGIQNVIRVSREIQKSNNSITAITIDSGDLHERAVYARKAFDKAGFPNIKIALASNLNEWKIQELKNKKTPVDSFVAVTELSTASDDPKLEVVYKLSELRKGKKVQSVAKFAVGKISYPGKKQVFRIVKNGNMQKDILGLDDEKLGKPLLIKIATNGKFIYKLPTLDKIKNYTQSQIALLPKRYLSIEKKYDYPVSVSTKLKKLTEKVKGEH